MKRVLFLIWQFTWGLPQNLIGLIAFVALSKKYEYKAFGQAIVTYIPTEKAFGGISLGMFIFLNPTPLKRTQEWVHDAHIHEYGHTIQSLILGWLYFPVVGIPSFIWCNAKSIVKWRKDTDHSYYWLYCEGWANHLGRWASKLPFQEQEMLERGNYDNPF
ncbi:MAG: hypothetical protein LBJ12_03440 [Oscillospiraceae bacterium]|jgi:hypothetical protein|nr:hypothetical protein [Oscillospiraceae bacterium]